MWWRGACASLAAFSVASEVSLAIDDPKDIPVMESGTHTSKASDLKDVLREAVWGSHAGQPIGSNVVPRAERAPLYAHLATFGPEEISLFKARAELRARQRMAQIEVQPDNRTVNSEGVLNGYCYVGACCGWGHRLMRQAKTFSHVHFIQNRTMIMEWGPCPNEKGVAGSGKFRKPDFSSLMIDDSPTIVNFQDTTCSRELNSDCKACGAGNNPESWQWNEVVQQLEGGPVVRSIGTDTSTSITSGSFFSPFQLFIRSIFSQLKPHLKKRVEEFMEENNFGSVPVIGVHHRHGNGEEDDFHAGNRLNANNSRVIAWMNESVSELAALHGVADFRVFFASDSPAMARMYMDIDPRVFVFDKEAKNDVEGKGFIMPGWQGRGRSPGVDPVEKGQRCEAETIRSFLDMTLLGFSDLLVLTKRSTFTFAPAIMMAVREMPVCSFIDMRNGKTSFTCRSTPNNSKRGLVERAKAYTGLAKSSRRRLRRLR